MLGFLLLNTSAGNILISGIADGFGQLLKYAADAVKSLHEKQGNVVARFGLKLLFGATLVSFLSAAIVGLIY